MQKFDKVGIYEDNLVIHYKFNQVNCKITGDINMVQKYIIRLQDSGIFTEQNYIAELKDISIYNIDYQSRLKEYIDHLVYSLYFKIELPNIGYQYNSEIKKICSTHEYFKMVNIRL